jgi:hypothetical protein
VIVITPLFEWVRMFRKCVIGISIGD